MKKFRILAFVLSLIMLFSGCGVVREPSEEANAPVKEQRIVATSVVICQILEKLGVPAEQVVGIPKTDAYAIPEIYANATVVGSPMGPDMELVKSLNPTVVLSPVNIYEDFLKPDYDAAQIPFELVNLSSPQTLFDSIVELGTFLGREKEAKKLHEEYDSFVADFTKEVAGKEHPTVLILMGLPGGVYVAATDQSNAGALVKMAGGINVYGTDGDEAGFVQVNPEDMLQKDPDIILRTAHAMPEMCMAMFQQEFKDNAIWGHFRAVQENKVFDLDYHKFGMSTNFLFKEGLADLKPILYGKDKSE